MKLLTKFAKIYKILVECENGNNFPTEDNDEADNNYSKGNVIYFPKDLRDNL